MIETILYISLGWCIGTVIVSWFLSQVYLSWIIGFPIAKRFEANNWVQVGKIPSRVYKIGGFINILILIVATWVSLMFSPELLLYGIGVGALLSTFRMLRTSGSAVIEVYESIYSELNEAGKLIAMEDLQKRGVKFNVGEKN